MKYPSAKRLCEFITRGVPLHLAIGKGTGGMITEAPVIHIVDDDSSFRTAVSRLLRVSGYQVALYESAGAFLGKPPGNEPGCLLLDVRMPGMSGPELQDR